MTSKTLGYRLFGWGRIPSSRCGVFESDGILILDEGVPIVVTFRNYRAPGRRFGYRRSSGSGAVVVTSSRLAVFNYRWPVLDVPRAALMTSGLTVSEASPGTLTIDLDVATLGPKYSGSISVRLRTDRSADILTYVKGDSPLS
jgi:hypothetical protein